MTYRIIIILLITVSSALGQSVKLEVLEDYLAQSEKVAFHPTAHLSGWKQIILVRHGKPDESLEGWVKRAETDDFLQRYVTSEVHAIDTAKILLRPQDIDTLYSSSLNRAYTTAQLLSNGRFPISKQPVFREFENKAAAMPNLKLPKGMWLGTSRILWLLGLNQQGIESHKAARLRSQRAANELARMAVEDDRVILVAHGFLNRYLDKYLRRQGWYKIHDDGHDYLATKVFVMQVQN